VTLRELVESQRFCRGLSPGQCNDLTACAEERPYAPGVYLVLDGQVEVKLALPGQGIVTLETVGPDEAVGWSWFQAPYRCQFDARAVTAVRVLAFDAERLRALMERDSAVGYAVLKTLVGTLSERVQSCRLQVLDVYAPPGGAP
jgi:CRP-like cAMP-binding protein